MTNVGASEADTRPFPAVTVASRGKPIGLSLVENETVSETLSTPHELTARARAK